MRRSDREVCDFAEKIDIIKKCTVCRIAMNDADGPYIVPMNYGYELSGQELTLFFHCASEGRKIDIMSKHPDVAFEMDIEHGLITGSTACSYGMEYESVVGKGHVEFLNQNHDKTHGLNALMQHISGFTPGSYEEKWLNAATVFKIVVSEFTGKRRKKIL